MEIITLKDAVKISSLSYTYLYEKKIQYGFARQGGKGKWVADKKTFVEKSGILISQRQMVQELDTLLVRQTKEKR